MLAKFAKMSHVSVQRVNILGGYRISNC
jgi:acyl carrier protein